MKILVTGGCGFIGSHIVDAYVAAGHDVCVIDNLSSGMRRHLNAKAKLYECDITSPQAQAIIASEKPDVINHHAAQINVHLSTQNPLLDMSINIGGLLNILEAAKNVSVQKVIFASSGGAIHGAQTVFPASETDVVSPATPYGITKLTGEYYLAYFQAQYGMKTAALRYANVYGPRQGPKGDAGVVAIFIQNALQDKVSTIFGDGKQTRDYVSVDDVVRVNLLALEEQFEGVFHVGTAVETTVTQVWQLVQQALGTKHDCIYGLARSGETQRSVLSAQLLERKFGWKPQVQLTQGIADTVRWFQEQ